MDLPTALVHDASAMDATQCRQCAAPLPPPGPGGAGACGACGTLFGMRAELEEYARAVVEGRSDIVRPSSLPQSRMRVEWQNGAHESYRDRGGGRLRIVISHLNPYTLALWPVSLLAAGAVGYAWWFVRGSFSWLLLIATLFVGMRALRRTLALFDRFELFVGDATLRTRSSRFWPRQVVELPLSDVTQLFAIKAGRGYAVMALMKEGKPRRVVFPIATAEMAWYLERQVELALGITDAAVSAEVDRNMPAPAANIRRMALLEVVFLALVTGGTVFGVRSCGYLQTR